MRTREEIAEWLEKELSYDADAGSHCPRCRYELIARHYWIDHKSCLAANLATFLGYRSGMIGEAIYQVIEEQSVTGERKKDAWDLAVALAEKIGF